MERTGATWESRLVSQQDRATVWGGFADHQSTNGRRPSSSSYATWASLVTCSCRPDSTATSRARPEPVEHPHRSPRRTRNLSRPTTAAAGFFGTGLQPSGWSG